MTKESPKNDLQMVANDDFSLLILFSRFLATSRAPVTGAGMREPEGFQKRQAPQKTTTEFKANQDALKGDTCPKQINTPTIQQKC